LKSDFEKKFRVSIDLRNEKINKKIKDAEDEKIPYMIIVGDKELENKKLSLRKHRVGMLGSFTFEEVVDKLDKEIKNRL
jgi:threonyl-tRNA synthetase